MNIVKHIPGVAGKFPEADGQLNGGGVGGGGGVVVGAARRSLVIIYAYRSRQNVTFAQLLLIKFEAVFVSP